MIKKICIVLVLMSMSITLSSCHLFPKEEEVLAPPLVEPAEITYSVLEVEKGDIEFSVSGYGVFVSVDESYVSFKKRGGRIESKEAGIGDAVEEGQLLAKLEAENFETRVKIQELNLRKVQIAYERAIETGADKYAVELASIDLELAKIAMKELEDEKEDTMLYAPISGIIVYVDQRVREGDLVNTYQNIFKIADPTRMQLEYSGAIPPELKIGMKVDVKINNANYLGSIVMTPDEVSSDGDQSLKNVIRIEVEDLPETVELGDTADITKILAENENTIVVPQKVINTYKGRKYVLVLEDGLRVERDIKIGIETVTQAEVLEGLKEGDLVIIK